MTDSENSQLQDESDEDIYKDIPEFNFEDELAKLEGSKETYKQEANDLSDKVKVLTEENKELKKSNEVLKKNLSTLLKTAQAEVQRKDSMIEELRAKVESFTFRRKKNITKDKYTSTQDLEFSWEVKCELEKQKSVSDKKRSKSYEIQTSSDSERKSNQEKRKESSAGKEDDTNCDNDRKSGYRRNSNPNSKHSRSSHDRHREKKSNRYDDSSEYRRSYRKKDRDHLKCDSYDKKRRSRSSDSRFLSRRRHSRERKSDRRRRDSAERKRKEESSERARRRKERSRSLEIKEPSLEKSKSRSSLDKDSVVRIKEQISSKSEISDGNGLKGSEIGNGRKTRTKNSEKQGQQGLVLKNKQAKDKEPVKQEKKNNLDIFNTKSPLDALYNEMVTSRNCSRYRSPKLGTPQPESDLEEGELSVTQTVKENSELSEEQPQEDWALSFKNERANDVKPMTLYSRRMMRKMSLELKKSENKENKEEEKGRPEECAKVEKIQEVEKEPGELTDDENAIESSKEFQELTKVASIEIIENPVTENVFRKPMRRDSKAEILKEESKELQEPEKPEREDVSAGKEVEAREVIEFSPFKNNYKLIEISLTKPSDSEHVLDFYNQRGPPSEAPEQLALDSSEGGTEFEKSTSKPSDTSDEKNSESELKIVIPPPSASPEEKITNKRVKESVTEEEKSEEIKSKDKKDDFGKRKRKSSLKKDEGKLTGDEKNQKRKRKSSETDEGQSDAKKKKLERRDSFQTRLRSTRNLKNEPENTPTEPEPEKNVKEDISSFGFFKPPAKAEVPQTPVNSEKSVSTTTDYKMTATMSVTGVVRLETPDKCMEKLKNLMINEHMIFNVLDSKNNSQFSPLIGSKCIEMTPRRMLKNDLMLTDSEDDSTCKQNSGEGGNEEVEEEEDDVSGSENSEGDSDSGASDFVDLL